jgi:hypothetical protein
MDHLEALTDRYGPRLTASPEYDEAAAWAAAKAEILRPGQRPSRILGTLRSRLERQALRRRNDRPALLAAQRRPPRLERPHQRQNHRPPGPRALQHHALYDIKKADEEFGECEKRSGTANSRAKSCCSTKPVHTAPASSSPFKRYTDGELAGAMTKGATPAKKLQIEASELDIPDDPGSPQVLPKPPRRKSSTTS